MDQLIEHIANEDEIKIFHSWIGQLCDPNSKIVQHSQDNKFQAVLEQHQLDLHLLKNASAQPMTHLDLDGQKLLRSLANKYVRINFHSCPTTTTFAEPEMMTLSLQNCYGKFKIKAGKFRIRSDENDAVFEGNVESNENPHGFCRVINSNGDLEFFGCFVNGQLVGKCWRGLIGGSFMVSDQCNFSGPNTIYFYPDCRTAIVGNFGLNGILESGHMTEIVGVDQDAAQNPEPYFLAPDVEEGPTFQRDISTKDCICKQPMLPDPYEQLFVYVDSSRIPEAGQGLFAKIDIEADTVVSFYNGTRFASNDPDARLDSSYKINFDDQTDLDIPENMANLDQYCASLGHKVCHSFTPNCEFDNFDHPRFGPIKCIVSQRPIAKGEEITVHYEYILAVAPSWYKKLWARHQKNLRGMPSWKMALACKTGFSNKYSRSGSSSSGSSSRSISECFSPEIILEESEEELAADCNDDMIIPLQNSMLATED